MLLVLLAMLPAVIVQSWIFGAEVLAVVTVAMLMAVAFEAVILWLRRMPIMPALSDGSAAVTGALLGLAVTPLLGWMELCIGVIFAIGVAKHCYGGLGRNPFNPAMAGYALLIVSFPASMAWWPEPVGISAATGSIATDGITAATPLDSARAATRAGVLLMAYNDASWLYINAAWLLGGVGLLLTRVINLHVPGAVLLGMGACACVTWIGFDGVAPWLHLTTGATMACAFFIATDPVSAPKDPLAMLGFGAMIGALTVLIREFGAYPDGVAFAVLLANLCAPALDHAITAWRFPRT